MALPRGLILLAAAWLFLSWLGSMGVHPPLVAAASSYTPSVRLMILTSAAGALIAWPLVRLCQHASAHPVRDTLFDLLVVLGMLNMVLWPLRLVTPWPPSRMALVMVMVMLGIIAVSAVVAAGRASTSPWARSVAMSLCLILSAGLMPWRWFAPQSLPHFPSIFGGPFEAIIALATSGGAPPRMLDWSAAEGATALALLAWAVALITLLCTQRCNHRRLPASESADRIAAWS